jgi:hypothetical protein
MKIKGITKGWVKPKVNLAGKTPVVKSGGCASCNKKKKSY